MYNYGPLLENLFSESDAQSRKFRDVHLQRTSDKLIPFKAHTAISSPGVLRVAISSLYVIEHTYCFFYRVAYTVAAAGIIFFDVIEQ